MANGTVGSLMIDLRANVAQLQADMDQMKSTVQTSSRDMSNQMKADMNETRMTLALMRDDFGVGLPRELRKAVASIAPLREAILALGPALYAIAFFNIGIQVFDKISAAIDDAAKHAAEEAAHTRDIADAAQKAVLATEQRAFQLELIGKGEEERAALQKKYFQDEITRAQVRMASLQAEIAAKLALINLDDLSRTESTDPNQSVGDETDRAKEEADFRNASMKELMESSKAALQGIKDAQKAIDDATKSLKESDDHLFVYEQGLAISRIKNWQTVADAQVAQQKDAIEKMQAAGRISVDQELITLRTLATEKYNIQLKSLQDTLDILEKDPTRNVEKIEAIQAQMKTLWIGYEKDLTDISALGVAERKRQAEEEARTLKQAFTEIASQSKGQGSLGLGGLINSLVPSSAPGLNGSMAAFRQSIVDNFSSPLKDAAAQSKLLEAAMQGLLTPTDKFLVLQQELAPLLARYKDQPDVIKAITRELNLANPEFQKLKEASTEFGKDFANELDAIILKGESFHDFLLHIVQDLAEIILKVTLLKPLENFFSGGGTGVGGFVGALGHIFGFAGGGRPDVGQVSLVGENGPELFVPDSAGTVIPNGQLGGGVTYVFNVDARGGDPGTEMRVQRAIRQAMAQSTRSSVAATREYSLRT